MIAITDGLKKENNMTYVPVVTDEKTEKAKAIGEYADKVLQGMEGRTKALFDMLWCYDNIEDSQALLDKFEGNALKLFIDHAALQDCLGAIDADYVRLVPPCTVTPNEDGTVTLSDWVVEEVEEAEDGIVD